MPDGVETAASQGRGLVLDILTKKGQVTLEQERRAIEIWHSHFPNLIYMNTPKNMPAVVDAVLFDGSECCAVVETKCRTMSWATFTTSYDTKWLVTFEKILKAQEAAEALQVPLLGFLYLVEDDLLLCARIWTPKKGWGVPFCVEKTKTQTTVNGGSIWRDNAYIDMAKANRLEMRSE